MIDFPEQSLRVTYVEEPELEFGHGQKLDHPKDGLFLYGPEGKPSQREVRVGVIGTGDGIAEFRGWLTKLKAGIAVPEPGEREKAFRPHLSDFPGMREAFGIDIDETSLVTYAIALSEIERTTAIANHHEAVALTADLFIDTVARHLRDEEASIDVWVMVLPEIIHDRCRPLASGRRSVELAPGEFSKKQKKRENLPLFEGLIDNKAEEIFDDVPDFHRQIKAKGSATICAGCALPRMIRFTCSPGSV